MAPRPIVSALLLAALILGAAPAAAGTWYVGIGLEFGSVSSDERTLLDGEDGAGLTLVGGHRFTPHVSLDLSLSGTLGSTLEQSIVSLGPKFDLLDLQAGRWTPWAALYISESSFTWSDQDYKGDKLGLSLGLGVDLMTSEKGLIQAALRFNPVDLTLKGPGGTEVGTFETRTTELTVSYVHHYW